MQQNRKKTNPRPRPALTPKKRHYKPRQAKPPAGSGPDSISLSSEPTEAKNATVDPAAGMLAAADAVLKTEEPARSTPPADGAPPADDPGGAPPALPAFDTNAFLVTTLAGVVDKGLLVAKLAGWPSPAIAAPPDPVTLAPRFLMTEEEWKMSVSSLSVQVIQKRWPSLASSVTPEFALLVLILPWAAPNLPAAAIAIYKGLKGLFSGKNNSDHRRDGNGENNATSKTPPTNPAHLFVRPDARSEV